MQLHRDVILIVIGIEKYIHRPLALVSVVLISIAG